MTLIGFLLFIIMGLYFRGDPRATDGIIDFNEMSVFERVSFIYIVLSIFSAFFVALKLAYERVQYKWMLLILFVWPISYYYIWKYLDWDEHEKQRFKDIARRVNK